jgi:hypothetical protein
VVTGHGDDPGAFAGEADGEGPSDALRRACDDNNFSC